MNIEYHQEDERNSNKWLDWLYMVIFLVILGVTWLLNLFLLLAIHRNRKGKGPQYIVDHMNLECKLLPNYYFIVSISIANILAVSFNPPIFIVFRWLNFNNNSLWRVYCLISISVNTVFCNLAFLHVLFSSLDTFLRLYSPRLYIFSQRRSTSGLKISAPWVVTCIQAGCQLSISSTDNLRSKLLQCLIDDVNFLILRSVISFAVPLVTCVILIILQIRFLRKLAHISDENMKNLVSTYVYKSQIPETLALINRIPGSTGESNVDDSKMNCYFNIPRDATGETLASIQSIVSDSSVICSHPRSGVLHSVLDFTSNHMENRIDKLHSTENSRNQALNLSDSHIIKKREMWNFVYKREQMSVALNMASCIVAIGIWSPLILSTLTYRLCEQSSCFFQIPVERISDFQWWSFAGGAMYPVVYMCLDRNLRRAGSPLCDL